jgi:PHS family inorganic phosphate transporter-like MFS transporter
MDIERNIAQATTDIDNVLTTGKSVPDEDAPVQRVKAPKATRADFRAYFGQWKNLKVLIGTAYSWFALDVSFNLAMRFQVHFFTFRSLSMVLVSTAQSF